MTRPRSRRPRSLPKQEAAAAPAQRKRSSATLAQHATALEAELAELKVALAQQQREFEQEVASFPQLLSRLAHSERTLGQTKTKLIAAEDALAQASAQVAALRARVQDTDAKMQHHIDDAREARSELSSLRDALAAALEREPIFQRVEEQLREELAELRQALASANQERDDLLGALGSIEVLAQRIARLSSEPKAAATDDTRVTTRPVAPAKAPARSRRHSSPEITIDGVRLGPANG
jgi:chromosome segregation ATPase